MPQQTLKETAQDVFAPVNPYITRGAEVRVTGIPGVTTLRDYLTPPGWRPGHPPINEQEATRLYNAALPRHPYRLQVG